MEAPEKIFLLKNRLGVILNSFCVEPDKVLDNIEYVRKDAFIERVMNFLNYKLDDVVATRVPGTIIPHHVAKQELIEDLKKYMKGE